MEKYNNMLKELKTVEGFDKYIDIHYDGFLDDVLITFYNDRAFKKLNNSKTKMWKDFKSICCKYKVNYKLYSYGLVELYF